jgi:hypothetical protein
VNAKRNGMRSGFIPAVAAFHSVTSTDGPNSTVGFRSGMPWRAWLSLLSTGKDAPTLAWILTFRVEKDAERRRSRLEKSPR